MDAYDLQQQLRIFWGQLSKIESGVSVKASFPRVPVYVKINDKLIAIKDAALEDNKIILDTHNE